MQQTACLVIKPRTVLAYALLCNCTVAVQASDQMTAFTSGLGPDDMSLAWPAVVQLVAFFISGELCL